MIGESAGSAWFYDEEMAWESPSSPRHARESACPTLMHSGGCRVSAWIEDSGVWKPMRAGDGNRTRILSLEGRASAVRRTLWPMDAICTRSSQSTLRQPARFAHLDQSQKN
jgi:hypothetical protein